MTTNRDRAAEILAQDRCWIPGPGGMERFSVAEGVDALDAEGVLKDDLPEPTGAFPYWKVPTEDGEHDALIHLIGKTVVFRRLEDETRTAFVLTRDEARGVARALEAAAEHRKEPNHD